MTHGDGRKVLQPCCACGTMTNVTFPPPGPLPPGMLIHGCVMVCVMCGNIMVVGTNNKLRPLTPGERVQIQPNTEASNRDARWEWIKQHHDRIVLELMQRMSAGAME